MGSQSRPFPQTSDLPSRVPILSDKGGGVGGWTSIHKHWDTNYWKHDMNCLDQQTRVSKACFFWKIPASTPSGMQKHHGWWVRKHRCFPVKVTKASRVRTPLLQDRAPLCSVSALPPHPATLCTPCLYLYLKKTSNVTTCSSPWSFICSFVGYLHQPSASPLKENFFNYVLWGVYFKTHTSPPPPNMHQKHDSLLRTRQCRAF